MRVEDLKIGDKVIINDKCKDWDGWTSYMNRYVGKTYTINQITDYKVKANFYSAYVSFKECNNFSFPIDCIEFPIDDNSIGLDINTTPNKPNLVNHPKHYNQHAMECIDEMIVMFGIQAVIDFCICNAFKYRERAPYKGKEKEDNEKADWYLAKAKELQQRKNHRKDGE